MNSHYIICLVLVVVVVPGIKNHVTDCVANSSGHIYQ